MEGYISFRLIDNMLYRDTDSDRYTRALVVPQPPCHQVLSSAHESTLSAFGFHKTHSQTET